MIWTKIQINHAPKPFMELFWSGKSKTALFHWFNNFNLEEKIFVMHVNKYREIVCGSLYHSALIYLKFSLTLNYFEVFEGSASSIQKWRNFGTGAWAIISCMLLLTFTFLLCLFLIFKLYLIHLFLNWEPCYFLFICAFSF